jgi:hypothetical protein
MTDSRSETDTDPVSGTAPSRHSSPGSSAGQGASEHTDNGGVALGIAGVERAFLRLTFWQTLLSLVGVFVGAVALYAALNESRAVRQQTSASVWPYLQLMISDNETDAAGYFEFAMANVGVGPARMQSMLLEVDGETVTGWQALVERFAAAQPDKNAMPAFGRSFLTNRVVAPGETISVFSTRDLGLVSALRQGMYSGRANLSYCYCSIFDDCWLQETQSPTTRPVAVDVCPDYGPRAFRD